MATPVNARTVLLQAANPRLLAPGDATIILQSTTPIFHIDTGGNSDPLSIVFTAKLIGMEGTVTFSASGGTLTSISGNTCALLASNMPGATATVTATLTYRGTVFSSALNIAKVVDGSGGSGSVGPTGPAGSRGAGHYYTTGSVWSDAAADAVTPGSNVVDDVVTISNGSTFVSEKKWTGSSWVPTGLVIDGSLLVTGTVTASKINSNGLSVRAADGTLILDAGGLGANYAAPGTMNNEDSIIRAPGGAIFTTTIEDYNGSIRIKLPQSWTSTMMKFTVDIFEYIAGYSCTIEISGYNYSGNSQWYQVTARVVGGSNVEYPVYFGHEGGKCCVYIGAASETWKYPQIRLRDFFAGYQNVSKGLWESGWEITISNAGPQNPTAYVLDTYPAADWAKIPNANGRPANNATVGAPSGTYVGGTLAQTVEANAANAVASLANKLSKNSDDILGSVLSINAVTAPAGFRAGSLTWNNSGARTGGYGVAMTPQGLLAYNSSGTLTFFVNATNGDAYFAGQLAAAYGSFGAVTIASGGSISSGQTAYDTGTGFWMQGGSTPKFSMKTSNGAKFLCDPGNNVLSFTGSTIDGTLATTIIANASAGATAANSYNNPFTVTPITGNDYSLNRSTSWYSGGTYAIVTSGGSSPFTYSWSLPSQSVVNSRISGASNGSSVTIEIQCNSIVADQDVPVQCIVSDNKGISRTITFYINASFS